MCAGALWCIPERRNFSWTAQRCASEDGEKEVTRISTAKCCGRVMLSKVSSCFLFMVAGKTEKTHLDEVEVNGQESPVEKFIES